MSAESPGFELVSKPDGSASLNLRGDWTGRREPVDFTPLGEDIYAESVHHLVVNGAQLGPWDSMLMAFLLRCHTYCRAENIQFETQDLPAGAEKLFAVATAVAPHEPPQEPSPSWLARLDPTRIGSEAVVNITESLAFIGEVAIALVQLVRGKASTRMIDFKAFVYQAGPDAFAIIGLVSILVGMILAYLGAVQLSQFGAEVYVADLVVIGTLREMGALMTAIVMAGRTGAAYAAQLGTMQANEEIDAITTMGISPIEFLVIPRMLALVAVMPLLTIYADILGIIGGRSSAAVGQAATEAVVTAIVYLIIADAAINIIFQQIGV